MLRDSIVFWLILASFPPAPITASEVMTPGPPALVIIAMFGPLGRGCVPNTSAELNRSAISSTRTTPARLKTASYMESSPDIEPVCDAAALALSVNLPDLTTIIGLVLAKCLAALINLRASVIPSTYMSILFVFGSVPK